MSKLDEYMKKPYRMEIVEDQDEGGFVVSYPDLPGCITCGETMESAIKNAVDAKREWFKAALEDKVEIHEPDSLFIFKIIKPRRSPKIPGVFEKRWPIISC